MEQHIGKLKQTCTAPITGLRPLQIWNSWR